LSEAVNNRVETMVKRHKEVVAQLNDPDVKDYSNLGKEMSSLASVVSLDEKMKALVEEESSVQELLQEAIEGSDAEMEKECQKDLERLATTRADLERRIMDAVLPKDPDDVESDAILEIRAGTGGDEASLFASELLDTYTLTAKAMKWRVDVLDVTKTDLGGVREAAISVTGRPSNEYALDDTEADEVGPYGFFKFESGVHRVQRVPINDSRIHTSACSVGVLPSLPEETTESFLPVSELKIETMRASGAGGQHVNTTDSAVRITHIPTGISASIQDERSQHKNKAKAMKLISARVREHLRLQEEKARGEQRSSLMGGGDRSERIRTYNFPQDRVTDHRCKHSTHGIEKLLQGGLDGGLVATFYPIMNQGYKEELMKELES
jgi:peptide chain release factor 1